MMLGLLNKAGINTDQITISDKGTGQAFILLQESSDNSVLLW